MPRTLGWALLAALLTMPVTLPAQWLNPSLDAQRWNNLRNHQQKIREDRLKNQDRQSTETAAQAANRQPLTLAERQTAWSQNKAEYRKRLMSDGKASADRWLDQIAMANRR